MIQVPRLDALSRYDAAQRVLQTLVIVGIAPVGKHGLRITPGIS